MVNPTSNIQPSTQTSKESVAWKAIKNKLKLLGRDLFLEGIQKRMGTIGKIAIGSQLTWSGFTLGRAAINGMTFAEIIEKMKSNFFLDNLLYAVLKDGQPINNLDGYVFLGLTAPSIVQGLYKGGSAKIGKLIGEKSIYDQKGELVQEYAPTKKEKAQAYVKTACEKIPKYIAGAYTAMVMFKTDMCGLSSALLTLSTPSAQQAIEAVKESIFSPPLSVTLGTYAIYHGLRMIVKR